MSLDKPARDDVLYSIAVLSMHATQLESEAATAYDVASAARLRRRAVQIDAVVAWLNATSIDVGPVP